MGRDVSTLLPPQGAGEAQSFMVYQGLRVGLCLLVWNCIDGVWRNIRGMGVTADEVKNLIAQINSRCFSRTARDVGLGCTAQFSRIDDFGAKLRPMFFGSHARNRRTGSRCIRHLKGYCPNSHCVSQRARRSPNCDVANGFYYDQVQQGGCPGKVQRIIEPNADFEPLQTTWKTCDAGRNRPKSRGSLDRVSYTAIVWSRQVSQFRRLLGWP